MQRQYTSKKAIEYEDLSFPDDDYIDIKKSFEDSTNYDVNNIHFDVKLERNKIFKGKAATIPLMCSVFAPELEENSVKTNFKRPSIDLILVIDRSGSMIGQKINLVKGTLEYLVSIMANYDRLSIILFDHNTTRVTPLQVMNDTNKQMLNTIINNISTGGGTNITRALDYALATIRDRKVKNPLTSIFLLSDGIDNDAHIRFKKNIEKANLDDNFNIDTFGFGSDHDPRLMTEIAESKNGNFYLVENLDSLDECFVNAFGGMISVAAQNISFNITLNKEKFNLKVNKTYGNWKSYPADNFYQYQINYLMAGISKEYLMSIDVPGINDIGIHKIANCLFEAESTDGNINSQKSKEILIEVIDDYEEEKLQENDKSVQLNLLRLKGGEVLTESIKLCDTNQYQKARSLIENFLLEVNVSNLSSDDTIRHLIKDLTQIISGIHEPTSQSYSLKKMWECKGAYMNKKTRVDTSLYSNNCQNNMMNSLRMKKYK